MSSYILRFATIDEEVGVICLDTTSSDVIRTWTCCSRCTYINSKGRLDCEVCGNALRNIESAKVIDLTEDEENAMFDPIPAEVLVAEVMDDCDFEWGEFSATGVDDSDQEIVVLEVNGRRFGDTSKRGKNRFCGGVPYYQ